MLLSPSHPTLFPYTTLFRSKHDSHRKYMHCIFVCTVRIYTDRDRKSTRLNSSHVAISYAVFCLKKKKLEQNHLNTSQYRKLIVINNQIKIYIQRNHEIKKKK